MERDSSVTYSFVFKLCSGASSYKKRMAEAYRQRQGDVMMGVGVQLDSRNKLQCSVVQ